MSKFSCIVCGLPQSSGHHDTPEACIGTLRAQADALREQLQQRQSQLEQLRETVRSAGAPEFDERLNLNDFPSSLFQLVQDAMMWKQNKAQSLRDQGRLQEENKELRRELTQLRANQPEAPQAHD